MPDRYAQIYLEADLPHLDHLWDYSVPEDADLAVGSKVRVRFHGSLRDGYVMAITDHPSVDRRIRPIKRVITAQPVLTNNQIALIDAVAHHYAGSFMNVARLAVPDHHATTYELPQHPWPAPRTEQMPAGGLTHYPGGSHFLNQLEAGASLRAFWQPAPSFLTDRDGHDGWMRGFTQAAIATLRSGRNVLVLVPDAADMAALGETLTAALGVRTVARLHSQMSPATRYRNYLSILRGQARVVLGTRSAIFAPLDTIGLIMIWDESDPSYAEQRSPYPHARDCVAIRADLESASVLMASYSRSAQIQQWVEQRWLIPIELPSGQVRAVSPRMSIAMDSDFERGRNPHEHLRVPQRVFDVVRLGLMLGSVLVHVPRAGYLRGLYCSDCATPLRCEHCHGSLQIDGSAAEHESGMQPFNLSDQATCRWCARKQTLLRCGQCGSRRIRATVTGSRRTAQELAAAFPHTPVIHSSGDDRVDQIPADAHSLVVATGGAEPVCEIGYAALVILDADRLAEFPRLRAQENALRIWFNALSLVRPGQSEGRCVIAGFASSIPVQAFIRLDPAGFARHELDDRRQAGFPPAVTYICAQGDAHGVEELIDHCVQDPAFELLGPAPTDDPDVVQAIWRTDRQHAARLVDAVRHAMIDRSASGSSGSLRVSVDPYDL